MDQFVILSWLEKHTGIESSSWVMFFTFAVFVSNFVSRRIPDDATGWKKTVKEVTKFIGLYTPNKITKDTTATDILREQVETRKPKEVAQYFEETPVQKGPPDVKAEW